MAITLIALCGVTAALAGALLGFSFTRGQRKKYKVLTKLDGKQIHLAIVLVVCTIGFYGARLWKDVLNEVSSFDLSQGPRGELSLRASDSQFKQELLQSTAENRNAAEDYFNAAERDFMGGVTVKRQQITVNL